MTEQEVMERIKSILYEATTDENAVCYVTDYDETPLKIAIESLEKQIPMKPQEINEERIRLDAIWDWSCSNCGRFHRNDYPLNYCSECGQKVDWSDWT